MIIHCTGTLADRLADVSQTPLIENHPLGSWHASWQLMNKTACVAFCHDRSRYTLFLPAIEASHLEELANHFIDLFLSALACEGFDASVIARMARSLDPIHFDRATDHSVLGALRAVRNDDLLKMAPLTASLHLSHRPTTIHGLRIWPDKVMAELVQALQATGSAH